MLDKIIVSGLLLTILITINACKKNSITGPPDTTGLLLPDIADPIPYDKLGSGKIVFQRIGPIDNNYEGVYVIDINNKKSWGLKLAPIDAPQVSPDGESIAFTHSTDFITYWDVYLMDIYGNDLKQVSSIEGQERCPTWLSDNNRIIFYSDIFNPQDKGDYIPTYISDIKSKSTTKILDFVKINYPHVYEPLDLISVSKNDMCVASLSQLGICTFNTSGKDLKTIVKISKDHIYHSPVWNPTGDKIAIMAIKLDTTSLSKEMSIIIFNEDGSDSTEIFSSQDNEIQTQWNGQNNYSLCWSPDGSKILFNLREGYLTSHIYMINSDGTNLTTVTSLSGVTDRSLSWGK